MAITSNVTPAAAPSRQTLASAYIDFADGSSGNDWSQQYLPDLMAKESEKYCCDQSFPEEPSAKSI